MQHLQGKINDQILIKGTNNDQILLKGKKMGQFILKWMILWGNVGMENKVIGSLGTFLDPPANPPPNI